MPNIYKEFEDEWKDPMIRSEFIKQDINEFIVYLEQNNPNIVDEWLKKQDFASYIINNLSK